MNNRFTSIFVVLFVLLSPFLKAQQNDAALWTSISLEKKIVKSLTVGVRQQARISNNISSLSNSNTNVGITYKPAKFMNIGLDYRFAQKSYINKRQTSEYFGIRHQLNLSMTFKYDISKFKLNYRAMLSNRVKDLSFDNVTPYKYYLRNRLVVKYPINRHFAPYIEQEFYYRFNDPDINKNRFNRMRSTAGLIYTFTESDEIDVYYRIRQDINSKFPQRDFIIGLGYTHVF